VKLKQVLELELNRIRLSDSELEKLNLQAKKFCLNLEKSLKKRKIKASVFIGGSLAKKTILKKDLQDVDIFVRFDSKYKDTEISDLLEKSLKARRIHGSRDYFQLKKGDILFEIIPVINVSSSKQARNITDLSYFHVSYVLSKLRKNPKLANEIMLAKSFCHGQGVYGAESYISGFSGYALELLVIYYKSFVNFLKAAGKQEQIVLDPSKYYKNKQDILDSLNEAKLSSPIIFVDPTNKNRNALAALSKEAFIKFQVASKNFLKKPSLSYFQEKEINSKDYNFIIKARTDRQEGDIAGSKLKKFFGFIARELGRFFAVNKKAFRYNDDKTARLYFNIKPRKELILNGPPIDKTEHFLKFKLAHKNTFIKNKKIYAKEKITLSPKEFLKQFKIKNFKVMRSMGIIEVD